MKSVLPHGTAFLLCAAALLAACGPSSKPKANVILLVFDTLRPDHTGAYGYGRATTPNLDRLAAKAIRFEEAIAPASFTLPSMATLFTSLDPPSHGVRRHLDPEGLEDRLGPEHETLAERLQAQGYRTGAVVSNSLFLLDCGFDQGFAHFDPGGRRDAGPTVDAALAWLGSLSEDAPFFLWIHFIDPHWPYDAPAGFERPFHHPDQGQFQRMLREFNEGRLRPDRIYFECPIDGDGVRSGIAEYDNEIACADRHLGRLLDYLDRENLFENTLIAAVSDHGEALGEHGLTFAHSFTLYDEIQKVVLVLKPPGWSESRSVGVQVRLLDFMPTVLSLAGLDAGEGLEGRDLSPLWLEEGREREFEALPAYAESEPRYRNRKGAFRYPLRKRAHLEGDAGKWRMIRSQGFKLILVPGEGMELYDLAADPGETRNVIAEHPGVAGRLQDLLQEMIAKEKSRPSAQAGAPLDQGGDSYRLFKEMGY